MKWYKVLKNGLKTTIWRSVVTYWEICFPS